MDNRGVAAAWNSGIRRAFEDGCSVVFVLNDDIIICRDSVDHIAHRLVFGSEALGVLTGSDIRNFVSVDEAYDYPFQNYENDIMDAPDFAFFALTKDAYETVGEFDENFHPAYFEDNDYVYRCLLAKMRPVRSQNGSFYHYGSRTQNAGPPVVPSSVFEHNRNYFVGKWGGMPGEEVYNHPYNNPELNWRDWRRWPLPAMMVVS